MSKNLKVIVTSVIAALLVVGGVVLADNIFQGDTTVYFGSGEEATLGTVTATGGLCSGGEPTVNLCNTSVYDLGVQTDLAVGDDVDITGNIVADGNVLITPGNITATTTLTTSSPNEQFLRASASQITVTLPAAANATGTRFMFRVAGALTGVTVQITSAEKDNIDGALIVAGAVVACAAEDYINIITDGELPGDYVELISKGYEGWMLGDSGVTASGKMTCTDPS